jgi:tyrosine-protein phosphatase SIW14
MKTNLLIATLLVGLTGCYTDNSHFNQPHVEKRCHMTHGIPNFRVVDQARHIYRGGQPTAKGWAYLKSIGVEYDLKLNTWSEASDEGAFDNGIILDDDSEMTLVDQTIGEPNDYKIECALQRLKDSQNVFVHCEHGQDRTGLIIAEYRFNVQGWTRVAAEKEMMADGFHPWLRGLYWAWQEKFYWNRDFSITNAHRHSIPTELFSVPAPVLQEFETNPPVADGETFTNELKHISVEDTPEGEHRLWTNPFSGAVTIETYSKIEPTNRIGSESNQIPQNNVTPAKKGIGWKAQLALFIGLLFAGLLILFSHLCRRAPVLKEELPPSVLKTPDYPKEASWEGVKSDVVIPPVVLGQIPAWTPDPTPSQPPKHVEPVAAKKELPPAVMQPSHDPHKKQHHKKKRHHKK